MTPFTSLKLQLSSRSVCAVLATLAYAPFAAADVSPPPAPTPAPVTAPTTPSDDGPFMIRLRAIWLVSTTMSDAIPSLKVPDDAISMNNKVLPEVDLSWFFHKNFSTELVLTYPQKQTIYLDAGGTKTSLGSLYHLPPSLLVQFHPLPDAFINPYIGAGVNVTLFTSSNLAVPGVGKLDVDDASVGFVGDLGADIRLSPHVYLNLDMKYVTIGTNVSLDATGDKVTRVNVNPFLFAAGLGYRF